MNTTTKPEISAHRFRNCAGLSILNHEGTVYLTAKECRKVAANLYKIARSIERESFAQSQCGSLSVSCHTFAPSQVTP